MFPHCLPCRPGIQGPPLAGSGPTFQPCCPSYPMHGIGVVATHGQKVLPHPLLNSLIALPFYPLPWTFAVPVLTDFLFPVDKRNSVMVHKNSIQLYPMSQSQLLSFMRGYLQFSKLSALSSLSLLCPHSLLLHLCLENPHLIFMVQPGHLFLWEVLSFPSTSLAWFGASHMFLSSCISLI